MLHNMPMPICACTGENKAISNLEFKNHEPTPKYAFMGAVSPLLQIMCPCALNCTQLDSMIQ